MSTPEDNTMRRFAFATYVAITLLLCSGALNANPAPYHLPGIQSHTLHSKHTQTTHTLLVSLPGSYGQDASRRYPVVYFLDAYWDMPLLYATYGNLQYDKVIPEAILVGLSLPEGASKHAFRTTFFSPSATVPGNNRSGRAADLYKALTEEITPYIEKHFQASLQAKSRTLAGQSMGGLFTLFAMYQTPQHFTQFIAVNPAISWAGNAIEQQNQRFAKHNKSLAARLFISHGSEEYAPFRDAIVQFKQTLEKNQYQQFQLKTHTLDGMRHTGGKGEAYARGLIWGFAEQMGKPKKSGLQSDMGG